MRAREFIGLCFLLTYAVAPAWCAENQNDAARPQHRKLAMLIPNFDMVTDRLWRGSAPSAVAMSELKKSGIKTIIDLRLGKREARREQTEAKELGITYVHLPMGYSQPDETKLNEFLAIVQNPVYQPVYVHCRQGADRTGTLVAAYRILIEKWTLVHAYQEMRKHHFKPWLFPLRNKVKQIATAGSSA